jgi:hypothetical protein
LRIGGLQEYALVDHQGDFEKHQAVYADVLSEQKQIAPLLDKVAHIAAQRA